MEPGGRDAKLLVRLKRACHEDLLGLDLLDRCPLDCLHCRYARARAGAAEEDLIVPADRVPMVLEAEVRRRRLRGRLPAFVVFGPHSEPFPPSPMVLEAALAALRVLLSHGVGVSLETRCAVPREVIDLLARHRRLVRVRVAFFSSEKGRLRQWEGAAGDFETRLFSLESLVRAGVPSAVHVGPIVPTVNDDPAQHEETLAAAQDLGVRRVTVEYLRRWPGLEERLRERAAGQDKLILAEYYDRSSVPPRLRWLPPAPKRSEFYRELGRRASVRGLVLGYCRCADPELGRPPCNLGFGTTRRPTRQLRLFGVGQAATRKSRPSIHPDEAAKPLRRRRTRKEE